MGCRNSKAAGVDEYAVTYAAPAIVEPPKPEQEDHTKDTNDLSVSIAPAKDDDSPDQGDRFFDTNLAFANTVWKTAVETREVYAREKVKQSKPPVQTAVESAPAKQTAPLVTMVRADSASSDDSAQDVEAAVQYNHDFFKTNLTTANFAWTGNPPHGAPEDLAGGVAQAKPAGRSKIPNPFANGKITLAPVAEPPPTPAVPQNQHASDKQSEGKHIEIAPNKQQAVTSTKAVSTVQSNPKTSIPAPKAVAAAASASGSKMGPSMKQLREGVAPAVPAGRNTASSIPKPQYMATTNAPTVSPFAAQSQRPFTAAMPQMTTVGGRSNPFADKDW